MRRDLAIAAALVVATLAVYAQTLRFDFITLRPTASDSGAALAHCSFDDDKYVTRNPWVQAGIGADGVRAAFGEAAPFNWSPLVVLSLMLDATLFGVDPAAFHAVNAVLHALDAVLVYVLLRLLTGAIWPSAIAAALFALHPLRVESVAWVSGRKDVLSAAFGFSALIAYVRFAARGSRRAYAGALVLTVAALLSKATWVSLPGLFLLLDYWPLRRTSRGLGRLLAEKIPFFAAAAALTLVTAAYQEGNRITLEQIPFADRLVHAFAACAWYLAKTLWPVGLAPHYPHPYLATSGGAPWTGAQLALAALALAALTALAVRFARRGYPLVGWLWFVGTLLPVLGFAQYGTQGMADRYTHLPHVGLFAAAVFGGWELLVPRLGSPLARGSAVAAVAAALLALGSASFVQTRVWRDAETLFAHSLRVTPHNAVMRQGIARCYLGVGRVDDAQRMLEEVR
ncbi:MAG: tetratricopeptide repeat protein [Deltaproteobacteria bacterium]|nr:MAG: tetratricopeptide repeat protein [Deltaproteobacteria bacterium]